MMPFLLAIMPFIGGLWDTLKEELKFLFPVAGFLVELIVLTIILYIAGLMAVGGRRAKFSDAFLIALIGTIVGIICAMFISSFLVLVIVEIVVWLGLIKHFYETGWLGALAVAILSVIAFIVVLVILAIVFAISLLLFENLFSLVFSLS